MSDPPIEDNCVLSHADMSVQENKCTRDRKLTEKGLQYEIATCERKFKAAVSSWRLSVSKMTVSLSDSENLNEIRKGRANLEKSMTEVYSIFNRIKELHAPDVLEIESITSVLENVEIQHQGLMCKIADRICEIRAENSTSQSFMSRHSSKSNLSRKSKLSSVSKHSDIAIEAATLKAKLKYIDAEAQSKAEFEKIVTKRKLEIAQAKLGLLDDNTPDSLHVPSVQSELPTSCYTKDELVSSYVRDYRPCPDNKPLVHTLKPNHDSVSDNFVEARAPKVQVYNNDTFDNSALNPNARSFSPPNLQISDQSNTANQNDPVALTSKPLPQGSNFPLANNVVSQEIIDLTKSLSEQLMISRLPPPEPSIFDGDPLKYPGWKSAFSTLIEQKHIPAPEKIHYLRKYLGGPVKDVVANLFLLSTEEAYEEAKALLDKRYGDPFRVACAFRDKLDSWPKIAPKDSLSLLRLSDFLKQCLTAMQSIPSLSALNDCLENRKILSKLPEWIIARWNRFVVDYKERFDVFPPFYEFVDFMSKEAKIACDPVTSVLSLRNSYPMNDTKDKFSNKSDRKTLGTRSFLSSVQDNSRSNSHPKMERVTCPLCSKSHNLDVCIKFLEKPLESRKTFAQEKELCFGCLCSGHISKFCKRRLKCKTCSKNHPSSLHGDIKGRPTKPESSNTNMTADVSTHTGVAFLNDTKGPNKCSMVVPVYVSHCDNPGYETLVYALLDTQSDTTFVLDSTCEKLGVSGVDVCLSLSTMYAENKVVNSRKVKGLMVRAFNSPTKISLPVAFTRGIIPANRSHIPTPDIARLWPHLLSVVDHLSPLQSCEIGLLIGYNCAQALVPREVIPPVGEGPYAQKTDLGWGIVGMVGPDMEQDLIGFSHRIATYEIPSSLYVCDESRSSVSFSLRTSTKEVLPADVIKVMERDFNDTAVCGNSVSQDDRHFLSVLEQGIMFRNGHYEMTLPFRDNGPYLPNNKSVALRRLTSLKKRFDKDEKFRKHYFEFMQGLIANGNAEKVPSSETDIDGGHIWYIPHHGIYHPKKPDRIRVVFDCSVSFHVVSPFKGTVSILTFFRAQT